MFTLICGHLRASGSSFNVICSELRSDLQCLGRQLVSGYCLLHFTQP